MENEKDKLTSDKKELKKQKIKVYTKKDIWIISQRFIIGILCGVIILLLSTKGDDQFVAEFSFAATISSIILSILAIFMSINGESKTQAIWDKIELEAEEISKASNVMKSVISDLNNKIDSIQSGTDSINHILAQSDFFVNTVTSDIKDVAFESVEVKSGVTQDDRIVLSNE